MKNNIIDTQLFMESMEIEKIINDVKAENINYELSIQYYVEDFDDNKALIKTICNSGFKPNLMFKANFKFNIIVEFDKEATNEDVDLNIDDIIDPIGNEISYLIATLTRSMGGSALIIPPIVDKINKLES